MTSATEIDSVLITWGDRLFYPGNRMVSARQQPRLGGSAARQHAAAIRQRIEATVMRRAQQVMVKVTGGGRCMRAIAAHFRYISKDGRLDIEDQQGEISKGKDCIRDMADEWRFGGSLIDEDARPGSRREAFNIVLSMPRGTDPLCVQRAAREFARDELADHKYVMVLHDHQANPHVHISVRAESTTGRRLNPRKADLQRWRETFAEKLRGYGIDAEATRQAARGRKRSYEPLWRLKARQDGRLRSDVRLKTTGVRSPHGDVLEAWRQLGRALALSGESRDRDLAEAIDRFVDQMGEGRARPARQLATQRMRQPSQRPLDLDR